MQLKEMIDLLLSKIDKCPQINIGLIGGLGSGKTHLVKNLLKTKDNLFENQVSSPTYNICNIYQIENSVIHHFDLYRIESEDEIYEIEIWESIENSKCVTFIEWVDMFPEIESKCDLVITIDIVDENNRNYKVK